MKYLCVLLLLISLVACTEEKIVNNDEPEKRLVILTDHEKGSPFTISILGAIENAFPDVKIEYIHTLSFDIYESSYLLERAVAQYPKGTYFAAIVGTGVDYKSLIIKSKGNKIVCPDNGLCTRAVLNDEDAQYYYLENEEYLDGKWNEMTDTKLYKNAIIAMLKDYEPSSFGSKAENPVKQELVDASSDGNQITGQILFRDNFGNFFTNISKSLAGSLFNVGDIVEAECNNKIFFLKFGTGYSSVAKDENVCFVDFEDLLKFAVNFNSISERYSISPGAVIKLSKANVKLAVLMYNNSRVAEDIKSGFIAQLAAKGFVENKNLSIFVKSANGNKAKLKDLVNDLLAGKPDIFLSVSTPASQSALEFVPEDIPLIYTYVTDPQSAGLLGVRKNISGLSDRTNFVDYLEFVYTLLPNMKIAGNMFTSKESNSVYAKQQLEKYNNFYPFNILYEDAPEKNYFYNAYNSLKINGMEALLIVANNVASESIGDLKLLCNSDNIPLIGDSYEHCQEGALASISIDYDKLAIATGNMIAGVILGKSLSNEPVQYFHTDLIAINKTTANHISYTFPAEILAKAKYVFE